MRHLRRPLVLAALFLALGTLLARLAEGAPAAAPRPEPEFPRGLREPELERLSARRTLTLPAPPAGPGADPAPERKVDPFLAALPRGPKESVLVLEANALRHSRLGELFVECVLRREGRRNPFDELREGAGIDPLKDVDRVAFSTRGAVASGFFDRARFERDGPGGLRGTPRGPDARVYVSDAPGDDGFALGAWRGELLVFGEAAFVEETLARLGGGGAPEPPALPEYLTYGEGYGVVTGEALEALFRGEQEGLGRRLAEVASRIELHADAMRDVSVVARVTGEDAGGVEDLGKAFGAALSIGRIQAAARGDRTLAELLEHARVARGGEGLSLELALPVEVVERWFAGCGDPPAPSEAPAPPP